MPYSISSRHHHRTSSVHLLGCRRPWPGPDLLLDRWPWPLLRTSPRSQSPYPSLEAAAGGFLGPAALAMAPPLHLTSISIAVPVAGGGSWRLFRSSGRAGERGGAAGGGDQLGNGERRRLRPTRIR
jgi:hypothetical protein